MSKPLPNNSEPPVLNVTPVGTSPWIITRSKSYSGRIYYFNTLTGEAVWNLSSADVREIEKAKSTTKMLKILPGTNLENYPEPKEPPSNINLQSCKKHQAVQCYTPSTVYNKQVINNQFPRPLDAATYGGTQCLGCTSFHSPNLWAVPPNHQVLIAPTQSPIVNQLQAPLNITYSDIDQILAQNTSLPHSTRIISNQYNRFDNRRRWYGGNNINNSGCHRKKFFHKRVLSKTSFYSNLNISNQDLREKLSSRRQFQLNISKELVSPDNTSSLGNLQPEHSNMQRIKIIIPRIEDLSPTDVDDTWLKKYAFIQGTQLMLNVQPLRDIVITKQGLSCWYIVIDSTALLNHFNLINIVVNSDEQCQLMISNDVMTEVKIASRSIDINLMNRAIIVLQMLTQQFAAHRAVLGIDSKEACNSILDFSVKLSEQNNNVVLISENVYKISSVKSIPIYTIEELKAILVNDNEDKEKEIHTKLTEPITVTIHNDEIIEQDIVFSIAKNNDKYILNNQKEMDKEYDNNNRIVHPKNTIEMGVQTDTDGNFANSNTFNSTTLQEFENVTAGNINPAEGPKRRLIRTCHLNVNNDKNLDKREFVWHRRKSNSITQSVNQENESKNEQASIKPPNTKAYENVSDCDNSTTLKENITKDTQSQEDNYSDNTDSSIFIQRRNNEKKIIEETSSSGIISNTASNVDSESNHSILPLFSTAVSNENSETSDSIMPVIFSVSNIDSETDRSIIPALEINMANYDSIDKCVMFEIESPAMEESLKMKSDEWVSRFVQIMEEVLTEILKLNPPFQCAVLPPPWTLHEAAECIKKKFSNDSDIIDSAGKLTNVLYKISDRRGKIKLRLEPSEFMEMYSYGVYLIDSLQSILNDCEDVQTAQESLANLLSDIQDTSAHNAHNDTFSDNINDTLSAIVTPSSNADDKEAKETNNFSQNNSFEEEEHVQLNQSLDEKSSSSKRYCLRSAEKKQDVINEEQSVKFIRSIDKESSFFYTLNLKRKPIECNNPELTKSDRERESDREIGTDRVEKENSSEIKNISGPIIIRSFSKCAEFEEKLRRKVNEDLHMDTLDYTEEDLDCNYYDQDYNSDYDYHSYEENQEGTEMEEDHNDNDHLTDSLDINEHQITNFKWIAGRTISEVRDTLLQVNLFCNETRKELEMPDTVSPSRGQEIQEQAKDAQKQMCYLHTSLNNILNQEEKCFDDADSMQKLLKNAGMLFESQVWNDYRFKISKCLEQVSVLSDAIQIVIEATEA